MADTVIVVRNISEDNFVEEIVAVIGPFPSEDAADYWAAEHEQQLHNFDVEYEPIWIEQWPTKPPTRPPC